MKRIFTLPIVAWLMAISLLTACASPQGQPQNNVLAAQIYTQLARSYLQQGYLDLARDRARKALEQHQQYAPAQLTLAMISYVYRDLPTAQLQYQQAQAWDASYNSSLQWIGFLVQQNDCAQAHEIHFAVMPQASLSEQQAAQQSINGCQPNEVNLEF